MQVAFKGSVSSKLSFGLQGSIVRVFCRGFTTALLLESYSSNGSRSSPATSLLVAFESATRPILVLVLADVLYRLFDGKGG
jgi:hypothetical protein